MLMRIKTLDDLTELLSIPMFIFGSYVCYHHYLNQTYKELGIVLVFLLLITPKCYAFARKWSSQDE